MKDGNFIVLQGKKSMLWRCEGGTYLIPILKNQCLVCGKKGTITGLPAPIWQRQPDNTNVICNPFLEGCNQGFFVEVSDDRLLCTLVSTGPSDEVR